MSGFVGVSTLLFLLSVVRNQERMRAQCERFSSGQWLTMQRMMLYRRLYRLHLVGRAVTGTCFTLLSSLICWEEVAEWMRSDTCLGMRVVLLVLVFNMR